MSAGVLDHTERWPLGMSGVDIYSWQVPHPGRFCVLSPVTETTTSGSERRFEKHSRSNDLESPAPRPRGHPSRH
jgi:hypothetical protein